MTFEQHRSAHLLIICSAAMCQKATLSSLLSGMDTNLQSLRYTHPMSLAGIAERLRGVMLIDLLPFWELQSFLKEMKFILVS